MTLAELVETRLIPLRTMEEAAQRTTMVEAWRAMDAQQRLVWNKLITGAFRVGVSQALVIRAISGVSNIPEPVIAHRMMGEWTPSAAAWESLVAQDATDATASRPYPF